MLYERYNIVVNKERFTSVSIKFFLFILNETKFFFLDHSYGAKSILKNKNERALINR